MNRCDAHGLLNCKCREPLSAYLVRQFRESSRDRVVRSASWVGSDHPGDSSGGGSSPDRRGQRGEHGGPR